MTSSRRSWRRLLRWAVVLLVAAGSLWVAVSGGRDLLLGLAVWSLVAMPLVAAAIYVAKHDGGTAWYFEGGDRDEGHGPD